MAISNVGSNSRPGVCTSTTRPSAPYEGQLIYETDTNRVLIWDNAAWVMIADTDEPPGLQLIASTTFTAAANPFINGCFSSNYQNYLVQTVAVTTGAAADLYFRMRSGVNTPETGGVYDRYGFKWSTSAINLVSSNLVAGWVNDIGSATSSRSVGNLTLYSPNEATHTVTNGHAWSNQTGEVYFPTHRIETTTAYTGIELTTLSATTITGTMRVYGYRN